MADDLKRVGLVFTADGATDFKKSLSSINSLTQESYQSFKLTQSQYDKNTSSTQKLADKQTYLAKNTELYKSKVEVLKEQLAEMEGAENRNETAIAKKKKELEKAQTSLNNYQKGLNDVTAQLESGSAQLKEYADNVKDISEKATKAGTALSKGITAPIVAVGTASMVAWNELDEAYDNIVLKTGATGDALDSLNQSFNNVYGSMPSDSHDVSEAIGEINTRFHLTGEELEKLSTFMLQFAEITGSDVTQSTAYAQRVQDQWNLSLEDTQNVMGLVAKASQDTGISTDTLLESITKNSTTFKELGLSVGQSVGLMAQFESAGLNSDTMLKGLQKASQGYAKEGKSMSDGLADLVKRLQDSTTYQEAYNEVVDMFGSKNALAFATASKEGKINLDALSADLSDYSKVVSDTFEGTLDPIDQSKVALNNLKIAGADLGTAIQSTLAPVLDAIATYAQNFVTWFGSLDESIKNIIVTVGLVLASIGPLLVIIGTFGTQISNALTMLSNLKLALFENGGAFSTLQTAIGGISAPTLALVAGIGVLIAILVNLWNTNEGFRNNVIDIVNNISTTLQTLWDSILSPIITSAMQIIQSLWDTVLQPLWTNLSSMIATIISIVSTLWSAISPIINMIIQILGTVLSGTLTSVVLPVFQTVFGVIGTVVSTVFSGIQSVWNSVLSPVFNAIVTAIQWLSDKFSSIFNGIKTTVTSIFNGIKDAMSNPIETAKNVIKGIIDTIKGFFSNFHISLPHINLPHFSIKPTGWSIGDLLKGSIPSLGIEWYAKAMDKGMILDSPTIFGASNGNLLGAGEAGSETIVGTQSLMDMISNASNSGMEEVLEALLKILERLSPDNLYRVIVKAIEDGGFVVELDNREVGRIVKKYA